MVDALLCCHWHLHTHSVANNACLHVAMSLTQVVGSAALAPRAQGGWGSSGAMLGLVTQINSYNCGMSAAKMGGQRSTSVHVNQETLGVPA
jgi:hypothetical protein